MFSKRGDEWPDVNNIHRQALEDNYLSKKANLYD
jgi:hypothetical protein